MGADHVIDYNTEDIRFDPIILGPSGSPTLSERVKAITNGKGVDVVFESVGGKV